MQRKIIPYNPELKELAKKLRNESTLSEVLLWNHLKSRKLKGYKFIRQKPLLNYIVDFYCPELSLIIEVDGVTHDSKEKEDLFRQKELEEQGVTFIRFYDLDIKSKIEYVIQSLEDKIEKLETHLPSQ